MAPILAQTRIRGDVPTIRWLAQTPEEHVRWDARFSEIRPAEPPGRFRYATRLGFGLEVEGWGETVADADEGGSALRFGSEDARSLIREGAGTWRYEQEGDKVLFRTVYDYRVRGGALGRLADRAVFRPLMTWATRWSFDRLRLWIEKDIAPEAQMRLWLVKRACLVLLGLVWILGGLIPKLLFVRASEVDLARSSHLYVGSPVLTLHLLGLAEVLAGLWLVSGWQERWAVALTTLGWTILAAMILALDPLAFSDPYSGIEKNLGLLGCAVAVWVLSPITPKASRGGPG